MSILRTRLRTLPFVFSLIFCLAHFANPTLARAQANTGQIAGKVADSSGAVVPHATITAKNIGTNAVRTVQTSEEGTYLMTALEPATYQVTVSSGSFKPFVSNVEVTVGGHVTLDAQLSIGGTTSEVAVVAQGGAQVNTQTQELSQVVSQEQVSQLPSLSRNAYDFVALAGNVSAGDAANSGDARSNNTYQNGPIQTRGVGYNINGQRSSGTEVLLDGVENIAVFTDGIGAYVPINAVQEFRVTTSNFEAQYGRASGGVVNVTTRVGTNKFHGDLWEFNRLSAYTSNTETNDQINSAFLAGGGTGALPAPKGGYARNQFGFAIGGPILKNKLFFFGSTEWTRVRSSATLTAAVPTPQFLALTAPNVQNYFSTYGGGKTFNFIQTFQAGPAGIGAIPGVPNGTPVFGLVSYTAPANAGGGLPQNTYNVVGRFDYHLNDKTQMFFRYVNYNEVDEAAVPSPPPTRNITSGRRPSVRRIC